MLYSEVRWWLENYDGPRTKKYMNAVITDTGHEILGIPVGALRQMARKGSRGDWKTILQEAQWDSFEEILLLGLMVAYAEEPFCDRLPWLRQLLPRLDSWAHTDCIAPTLRPKAEELPALWDFAQECMGHSQEYAVRFGIVLMLDHFIHTDRLPLVLEGLAALRDDRYYVQMAAAWCLAEIAVQDPESVFWLLRQGTLPLFVHNKTIQKMRESRRIKPRDQELAGFLKRKETRI